MATALVKLFPSIRPTPTWRGMSKLLCLEDIYEKIKIKSCYSHSKTTKSCSIYWGHVPTDCAAVLFRPGKQRAEGIRHWVTASAAQEQMVWGILFKVSLFRRASREPKVPSSRSALGPSAVHRCIWIQYTEISPDFDFPILDCHDLGKQSDGDMIVWWWPWVIYVFPHVKLVCFSIIERSEFGSRLSRTRDSHAQCLCIFIGNILFHRWSSFINFRLFDAFQLTPISYFHCAACVFLHLVSAGTYGRLSFTGYTNSLGLDTSSELSCQKGRLDRNRFLSYRLPGSLPLSHS